MSIPSAHREGLTSDPADLDLLREVRPEDWTNPDPRPEYDLVVVGAGSAGLVTAAGAAGLGAKVALVERNRLGGDCLNTGCVPSKSLLAAAGRAAAARRAVEDGELRTGGIGTDFGAVLRGLRRIRADIAPHDGARRFAGLGVDVFFGRASFEEATRIRVGGTELRCRKAVVATGARPVLPDIPGLAEARPLTHETVFGLEEPPGSLAVLGGGPVGCELAQAFRRLGIPVILIHRHPRLLDREDPEASACVAEGLVRDGVRLLLDARLESVEQDPRGQRLRIRTPLGGQEEVVDRILVAAGRTPNVEGLGLERIGVAVQPGVGVKVDDFLRTTHPRVFACGDICLSTRFTHAADVSARIVIQNALFAVGPLGRRRWSREIVPRVTYTDPELAQVGVTAADAESSGLAVDTLTVPFAAVDRARTDGQTDGFARAVVSRGTDRILGITLVGSHAGELLGEATLALRMGLGLRALAGTVHAYPTRSEVLRKLGDQHLRTRLTDRTRRLLELRLRLGRALGSS